MVGVDELPDDALFYITLVVVMIIMLVILAIRTYVGLSAISEGRVQARGYRIHTVRGKNNE